MAFFKKLQNKEEKQSHAGLHKFLKAIAYGFGFLAITFLQSREAKRFTKDEVREVRKLAGEVNEEMKGQTFFQKARIIFSVRRIRNFWSGEGREIKELLTGQEDPERFAHNSRELFLDYFVPHGGNDFRPKALRPHSLFFYILVGLGVKLVLTGFLFLSIPSPATLMEITSANVVRLINQSRTEDKLGTVAMSPVLAEAAAAKAQDMLDRQYFAHDTPDGKRPWQWIDRTRYDYIYAGENLAMGFITAESVHEALMKSPTHRKNILNPNYRDIGLAVVSGTMQGHPTQVLVQFFGSSRNQAPTSVAKVESAVVVPTTTTPVAPASPTRPTPTPTPTTPAPATTPTPPVVTPPVVAAASTTAPVATTQPPVVGSTVTLGQELAPTTPVTIEPNISDLEAGSDNGSLIVVQFDQDVKRPFVETIIEYSNIFFLAFLLFLLITLILNIFIRVKVQRPQLIFQTVVVIALITAMALVKFHYVEQIAPQLLIL